MKSNNVCKISVADTSNDLSVSCFVLETDPQIMRSQKKLSMHRMILFEQGEGEWMIDGVAHPFCAGTLMFGFDGETCSLLSGESVRYVYIDFKGSRASALCHRFGIFPNSRKRDNFASAIPFCKECLLSTPQENIDIMAESVLLYIFSRISASQDHISSDIIRQILEYTEENFRDAELSISSVAAALNYNPKYLSHFFKTKMNVSYGEYLRSLRFKYAISLFELGISSVKNVAFLSGFSDPLYFSNAFKKAIGISPKEFIATLSEKRET